MRHGSNAFGCKLITLSLFLGCASPASAAERAAIPKGFLASLPYVIGGVLAIVFIGSVILLQVSQKTDRTSTEPSSTSQKKFKPLYKLLLEPGIIGIVFFIGMYLAYPYVAKELGVDPDADGNRANLPSGDNPLPQNHLPPPSVPSRVPPRR